MVWWIKEKKGLEEMSWDVEPPKIAALIAPRDWSTYHDIKKPPPSSEDIASCYQEGPSWVDFLSPTNYRDGYFYYNMSTLCE